jgi:signal transduction histidine kinase
MSLVLPARWRPARVDIAIASGLVVLAVLDVWLFGAGGGTVGGAMTMSAMGATLAWRRIAPLAVAILTLWWLFATAMFFGAPGIPVNIACLWLAFFSVGAMANRRQAVVGLVVGLATAAMMNEDGFDINVYLAIALTSFGLPWMVGALWWRHRGVQELRVQLATSARVAVEAERARLAREIHDVVSHAISMIVVQAAAADVQLEREPARSRAALHQIEDGARQALVEMRQMLHLLQPSGDPGLSPTPRLSDLDALVARVRASGLDVALQVEGTPAPLSEVVDLTAYRVVQEGLTNVLKHAGPCAASVDVSYAEELAITVRDTGRGPVRHEGASGFGLAGLDERVREAGGTLRSGQAPDGGFELSVRLPLDVAA